MMIPSYYGSESTQPVLTGRQQVASQGLNVIGQGLTQFFNWKTAQAGASIQPSQGGGYYVPQPTEQKNYTPLIIASVLFGTLAIGGVLLYTRKVGKKK